MKYFAMLAFLVLALPVVAQQNDGDELVTVPKKYVSAEGLTHQDQSGDKWIGIGKEIGAATRDGLSAVVDQAERFGSTKVGTFVMVMIAWKIMAKDVLGVVLGIPLLMAGVVMWVWVMKRMFWGYRVLEKQEGRTKFYKQQPGYEFDSSDARGFVGAVCIGSIAAFSAVMLMIIF